MKKMSKLGKSVLLSSLAILAFGGIAAGTTYALFTDKQETNVTVTAGKVSLKATLSDPELYSPKEIDKDGTIIDATNAASKTAFASKGTVSVEGNDVSLTNVAPGDKVTFKLSLKNESTIDTKFSVSTEVEDGFADYIKTSFEGCDDGYWYSLATGTQPDEMTFTIEIPTTVTQEQFNGTAKVKLVVNAVQANAKVYKAVKTEAALQEALSHGGDVEIKLEDDLDITKTLKVENGTNATIELGGHTITNTTDIWKDSENNWSLISVRGKSTLTINDLTGKGGLVAKENDCYAVDVFDETAKVIINAGIFAGNRHAVFVSDGTAEINGGYFFVRQKYPDATKADEFVLNCLDASREKGTAKIVVTGGEFVNFDPSDNWAEGENTNFLASGLESGFELDGDMKIFKVFASAESALTKNEGTITLDMAEDMMFNLNGYTKFIGGEDTKNIVINGNGHTLIFNCENSDCSNIMTSDTFEKLTINDAKVTGYGISTTNSTWNERGLVFTSNVELNNVTSDRLLAFKDGKKSILNDVTINETDAPSDTYAMWLSTGADVEIDGLVINSVNKNSGAFNRGIKIDDQYSNSDNKMPADTVTKLSIKNARFKTQKYSAIDVASTRKTVINLENVDISKTADKDNAVSVNGDISLVTINGGTAKKR